MKWLAMASALFITSSITISHAEEGARKVEVSHYVRLSKGKCANNCVLFHYNLWPGGALDITATLTFDYDVGEDVDIDSMCIQIAPAIRISDDRMLQQEFFGARNRFFESLREAAMEEACPTSELYVQYKNSKLRFADHECLDRRDFASFAFNREHWPETKRIVKKGFPIECHYEMLALEPESEYVVKITVDEEMLARILEVDEVSSEEFRLALMVRPRTLHEIVLFPIKYVFYRLKVQNGERHETENAVP